MSFKVNGIDIYHDAKGVHFKDSGRQIEATVPAAEFCWCWHSARHSILRACGATEMLGNDGLGGLCLVEIEGYVDDDGKHDVGINMSSLGSDHLSEGFRSLDRFVQTVVSEGANKEKELL